MNAGHLQKKERVLSNLGSQWDGMSLADVLGELQLLKETGDYPRYEFEYRVMDGWTSVHLFGVREETEKEHRLRVEDEATRQASILADMKIQRAKLDVQITEMETRHQW